MNDPIGHTLTRAERAVADHARATLAGERDGGRRAPAPQRPLDDGPARVALEPMRLRAALGRFATGVTIVTATDAGGRPIGLTANSFSAVSLHPPLVAWCLAKRSPNLAAFTAARHHAISVLSAAQRDVALRFARFQADKFEGIGWRAGPSGVPLIDGCLAGFECETVGCHDAGDHVLFLCRVLRIVGGDCSRAPLVFFRSELTRLGDEVPALDAAGR